MKSSEIQFNRFDLGMPDEQRDLANGYFYYLENMTVGDNSRQIRQVGDVLTTTSTRGILKEIEVSGTIYGLGKNGSSKYCIQKYLSGWSEVSPTDTANWDTTVNPFFVHYNGLIYFLNGTYIGSYTVANDNIVGHHASVGVILQGGVEWQGNLYGWNNQTIYKVTTSGTATAMITLSIDQTIVELIPYGNLLAIICTGTLESNMYLWDGITTTTFYDIVKIGTGKVVGGTLLNGIITVVIGDNFLARTLRIKEYISKFETIYSYGGRENNSGAINTYIISRVKEYRGFIYFIGSVTRPNSDDTRANVIFRYGSKVQGQQKSFCVYKNLNFTNPNITGYGQILNDFIFLDDAGAVSGYVSFFATIDNGDNTTVEIKTTGTFNQPGIVETGIYTDDPSINKELKAISQQYVGLSGSGIASYYKADTGSNWTLIAADSTVSSISHEAVNLEGSGANLPSFKEIAFRIGVYGGNTITGFKARYEQEYNLYGN